MPGKGRPFKKGNKAARGHGKGRPRLDIASLADRAAKEVLEGDLETLARKTGDGQGRLPSKLEVHRAKDRLSRMCKGRVPTRLAIAGDASDPSPVPFSYVEVAASPATAPEAGDAEGEEQDAAQ